MSRKNKARRREKSGAVLLIYPRQQLRDLLQAPQHDRLLIAGYVGQNRMDLGGPDGSNAVVEGLSGSSEDDRAGAAVICSCLGLNQALLFELGQLTAGGGVGLTKLAGKLPHPDVGLQADADDNWQ